MCVGKCVFSFRVRNICREGQNRSRSLKKVSCKHPGFRRKHTRDSWGWQLCVFIPLAEHDAGTTKNVEKCKKCVVPRQRTEEGRTKVKQVSNYYLYNCNCIYLYNYNSLFTCFPSHRALHFHTRAFLSLVSVFCALPIVQDTSTKNVRVVCHKAMSLTPQHHVLESRIERCRG
jgi:hypothetical protein